MPIKAATSGGVLIALGVIVTIVSDSQSVTSLIPAFIGAVFLILGLLSVKSAADYISEEEILN